MAVELLSGRSSPPQHDPGSSTAVYNFWKGDILLSYPQQALKCLLGASLIIPPSSLALCNIAVEPSGAALDTLPQESWEPKSTLHEWKLHVELLAGVLVHANSP